jgi:hypothetical protein
MRPPSSPAVGEEAVAVLPCQKEGRVPIFAVLVKRTYAISPDQLAARVEPVQPLRKVDEYYEDGDAETATVKYESDLTSYKLATDVVLVGKAWAPGGRPARRVDVAVEVAGRRKVIRVIGDRHCVFHSNRPPTFTEPAEFLEMEIRYERAYGGKDLKSLPGLPFFYPRNHQGTGLAVKNQADVVDGLRLPNLEDPEDLLSSDRIILGEPERWNQMPLPQGFGWFQKTWYPRCSFVGAVPGFVDFDEPMREETLGLVPRRQMALARQFRLPSFDLRFNNGASLGLTFPYLSGGEPVRLVNLTPEGHLEFTLPQDTPRILLDIGLGENELKAVLHTVSIRTEERQLDLVWRGAQEYPGIDWLPEMKRLHVEID